MLFALGTITGKGFLTHEDRADGVNPEQHGEIIRVEDNPATRAWMTRNGLTLISRDQATEIRNASLPDRLAKWQAEAADTIAEIDSQRPELET
tara:strand:- start:750 stop:1028 length:279 start_codon:yes stop_codon:yes gene_type:complete